MRDIRKREMLAYTLDGVEEGSLTRLCNLPDDDPKKMIIEDSIAQLKIKHAAHAGATSTGAPRSKELTQMTDIFLHCPDTNVIELAKRFGVSRSSAYRARRAAQLGHYV